jgi:hypothetical protein
VPTSAQGQIRSDVIVQVHRQDELKVGHYSNGDKKIRVHGWHRNTVADGLFFVLRLTPPHDCRPQQQYLNGFRGAYRSDKWRLVECKAPPFTRTAWSALSDIKHCHSVSQDDSAQRRRSGDFTLHNSGRTLMFGMAMTDGGGRYRRGACPLELDGRDDPLEILS